MITFDHVTIAYPDASPTLVDACLTIDEGEMVLVVGPTGSGKSTFLRAINGLVPHFTGGTLRGRVTVGGRDTATHPPRELADLVGVVPQDPMSGFVADTVEEELAYGMECLGLEPAVMRRRVEEVLDLLGLEDLRDRPLLSLSGGQRQRVAIGAVMTSHPRILVLDEPTSALDPVAAEEVLAALQRLVHDLGITVVMAEHRLERVVQYADRVILIPGGARPIVDGTPAEVLADAPVAPPVVQLGRLAGWSPLPLSVRDARRVSADLVSSLSAMSPRSRPASPSSDLVASASRVHLSYGRTLALRDASLRLHEGEIVALMGRNGAGKSSLLNTLVGVRRPDAGSVRVATRDPAPLDGPDLVRLVGLVPQEAGDLMSADSVGAECSSADLDAHAAPGTAAAILARLAPDIDASRHPRDLSEGQRLSLALAIVLAGRPALVCLDEPTRGLDYPSKARLVDALRSMAAEGHSIVLATHDVELVADVATRVVILADGEVVADGPTADVVVSSPMFAPQVSKILGPWLTVSDVAEALAG